MKIYNSLTKTKEEFIPLEPMKVKMYSCGPTVYNFLHIGNARPISIFDTLRRYFEYKGYQVTSVQNFTDIDDKIINRANEEGVSQQAVSERFIKEFFVDAEGLGLRPATVHPKVTETMDMIFDVIADLVQKGYAYTVEGNVYFRSRKFEGYGKLSQMPLEALEAGNRVDMTEIKEDSLDFVLWKAAKPNEPYWASPWGNGRPGWHIECTAMIKKHLGDVIDIHCGGQDLVFPHHENEIAQGECYTGTEYARYWMHNGFINVDNEKMSKSIGNFFTVRDVAEKFGYEPIKFMMLQAHYRSPINYSYDVMEQCRAALDRLYSGRSHMDFSLKNSTTAVTEQDTQFKTVVLEAVQKFEEAMEDDFNTADAIAALFDLVRESNTYLTVQRNTDTIAYMIHTFDRLCDVLGILYNKKTEEVDSAIDALIAERQQARKEKNFKRSDEIRDQLKAQGIVLEDTAQGVRWKREGEATK